MAPAAWLGSLAGLLSVYVIGTVHFVDNACNNVETFLPQELVGQELAVTYMTEVLCQHIAQRQPDKPLVISVHGPPGVGKTYTHLWLARLLYNQQPSPDLDCPGIHCRGYKVVYGQDYMVDEAEARLSVLKHEVVGHLAAAPDALLVVEEYDKLDCAARGLWRQLLQHPERANISSHRAVILMESNLGMTELGDLITQLGDRSKVTMQQAEQLLRDVVFDEWRKTDCEGYTDTHKLMSLIDVFLPYLPLERQHIPQLVQLGLQQRAQRLQRKHIFLKWHPAVVDTLAAQVTFEGQYPLDGAKVIEGTMTRMVNRLVRQAAGRPGCRAKYGCTLRLEPRTADSLKVVVSNNTAAHVLQQKQARQDAAQRLLAQQQSRQHAHIVEL